jgi:hypothetical protein
MRAKAYHEGGQASVEVERERQGPQEQREARQRRPVDCPLGVGETGPIVQRQQQRQEQTAADPEPQAALVPQGEAGGRRDKEPVLWVRVRPDQQRRKYARQRKKLPWRAIETRGVCKRREDRECQPGPGLAPPE